MNALEITCGAELERFEARSVPIGRRDYEILTGYETDPNTCWWCGADVPQKNGHTAHYCRGRSHHDIESCFRKYWNHFEWTYASFEAKRRAGHRCENCGVVEVDATLRGQWSPLRRTNLEVHHIVPVNGKPRFFSAWNLPWNLIVLCHDCHQDVHAAMRGTERSNGLTIWEREERRGQYVMGGVLNA